MQNIAHKSLFATSDFILLMMIVISTVLNTIKPLNILHIPLWVRVVMSTVLLLTAWGIILLTKIEFKKHKEKTGPGHNTNALITSGPLQYSRNPIYLGIFLLYISTFFIFNNLWVLITLPITYLLIKYLLVLPEEKILKKYLKKITSPTQIRCADGYN